MKTKNTLRGGMMSFTNNFGRARHSVRAVVCPNTRPAGRGLPALPILPSSFVKGKIPLCGLAIAVVLQVGMLASSAQAKNLFVESYGTIIEITPGGAQSTFASGLSPYGLACDSAGDLFVAATFSGNIYEFTPGGARSTFASGLPYPIALAFNSAGNLFVTTYYGDIFKITPDGTQSFFVGGLGMGSDVGLAFDSSSNLFVANFPEFPPGNIYEFTNGVPTEMGTFASGLNGPFGLACDSAGNLFESDYGSGNIYEFTNGVATERGTFASGLNHPLGLAFDSSGDLFESDSGSGNIYEFTPGGMRSTFATGLSGQGYLAFQPLHALAIVLSGTNVVLTWPTNVIGTLQFTTNLVSPAIWNTNLPSPVVLNGQNAVTNFISGSQQFFRLR
jgi:hypothetical protein